MKTTNYHCQKCGTTMKFQVREMGRLPDVIGCKTKACEGKSTEVPSFQTDLKNIDGIFFRPKTKDEWNGIKNQLKHEITQQHPTMKIQEVNKLLNLVTINIKTFVKKGGLIHLPIAYFRKTNKTKSVN